MNEQNKTASADNAHVCNDNYNIRVRIFCRSTRLNSGFNGVSQNDRTEITREHQS